MLDILIADDDKHLREGLAMLLEGQGYRCVMAVDGVDALAAFQDKQPDMCIFDVMMPRMDGMQLCNRVRRLKPEIPILLLTALDEEREQVKGLDLGADDYVCKPFSTEALLARIRALQRRYKLVKAKPPQSFSCQGLTVDENKMIARFGDKETVLTKRELRFLVYLLNNVDHALSRDEIFDHCWGRDFIPNSRTLDQFVSTVRNKLEKQLCAPRFITTQHGVGYKLDSRLLASTL